MLSSQRLWPRLCSSCVAFISFFLSVDTGHDLFDGPLLATGANFIPSIPGACDQNNYLARLGAIGLPGNNASGGPIYDVLGRLERSFNPAAPGIAMGLGFPGQFEFKRFPIGV